MTMTTKERVLYPGITSCHLNYHHWRMFGGMNMFGTYELLAHCTGCLRVVALDIADEE